MLFFACAALTATTPLGTCRAATFTTPPLLLDDLPELLSFDAWAELFGRVFPSGEERQRRQSIFEANAAAIAAHNQAADA